MTNMIMVTGVVGLVGGVVAWRGEGCGTTGWCEVSAWWLDREPTHGDFVAQVLELRVRAHHFMLGEAGQGHDHSERLLRAAIAIVRQLDPHRE